MPVFRTDQALWYRVGVWGELGYAVPNFGDDTQTLNGSIHKLVSVMGRNLSAVMHHADVDLRVPPSINTLIKVHKLIVRARSILAGRGIAPGTPDFEAQHATPSQSEFLIYPVPCFKVRNEWLKEWCGLTLNAISEACQHTENRKEYEVSTTFTGLIGSYLHRVYRLMATELFNVPVAEASKLDFTLTEAHIAAYDPGKFFSSTELIDRVPRMADIPTEDDLGVLTDGIPASRLVGLCLWPSGQPIPSGQQSVPSLQALGEDATAPQVNVAASFAPPPSP